MCWKLYELAGEYEWGKMVHKTSLLRVIALNPFIYASKYVFAVMENEF